MALLSCCTALNILNLFHSDVIYFLCLYTSLHSIHVKLDMLTTVKAAHECNMYVIGTTQIQFRSLVFKAINILFVMLGLETFSSSEMCHNPEYQNKEIQGYSCLLHILFNIALFSIGCCRRSQFRSCKGSARLRKRILIPRL